MSAAAAGSDGGLLHAVILGLVEGITEFLPISSTGHMIVVHRLLGGPPDPTLEVVPQLGAITAILVLYLPRLLRAARGLGHAGEERRHNLLWWILLGSLPAGITGLLAGDWIKLWLFEPWVVAATTLGGGVLLLVLEAWVDRRTARGQPLDGTVAGLRARRVVAIGLFQVLSLVPGASRAAMTIAGGLVCRMRRRDAAEFSFLLGLPLLYGACLKELWDGRARLDGADLAELGVATVVAFAAALAVVVPFVRFLERHTFRPFAWYRIGFGLVLIAMLVGGVFDEA